MRRRLIFQRRFRFCFVVSFMMANSRVVKSSRSQGGETEVAGPSITGKGLISTRPLRAGRSRLVPAALFLNRSATWPETVCLTMVPGGGHVGYLARPGLDPDMYWPEWRLLDLILGGSGRLAA
jgi:hypothetical protein